MWVQGFNNGLLGQCCKINSFLAKLSKIPKHKKLSCDWQHCKRDLSNFELKYLKNDKSKKAEIGRK